MESEREDKACIPIVAKAEYYKMRGELYSFFKTYIDKKDIPACGRRMGLWHAFENIKREEDKADGWNGEESVEKATWSHWPIIETIVIVSMNGHRIDLIIDTIGIILFVCTTQLSDLSNYNLSSTLDETERKGVAGEWKLEEWRSRC